MVLLVENESLGYKTIQVESELNCSVWQKYIHVNITLRIDFFWDLFFSFFDPLITEEYANTEQRHLIDLSSHCISM